MTESAKPKNYTEITVAVVDDEELVTKLLERLMQRMGFGQVHRIVNPMRFLDMVAEGLSGVHLVICDVKMPHADGHAVLEAVRETHPDMPFIMLTSDKSDDAVQKAIVGGVSAYVVKPIDRPKLTQKIVSVVDQAYGVRF